VEFSEIAAELYAGAPEEFVARRKELADQAKKAGEKDLAKQVMALRKPTKSAWLVNLLAHHEPDRIESWLELGVAMTEAQQNLAGDQLRELNTQRSTAARQLSRRAAELAAEAGQSTTDAALQEVSSTLQAAWTDAEFAELVRNGWVHQVVAYGGFGPLSLTTVPPAAREKRPPAETSEDKDEPRPKKQDRKKAEQEKAERERAEQERAEREAHQAELDAANAELDSATSVLTDLRERQSALSEELKQVTADERSQAKTVAELRARVTTLHRRSP
jgi:chromosome segregation ATPase